MKKSLFFNLLLLAIGLVMGILIMLFFSESQSIENFTENELQESKQESVNQVKQKQKRENNSSSNDVATSDENIIDTSSVDSMEDESYDSLDFQLGEEDFEIVSERMLARKNESIHLVGPDSLETQDLLSLGVDSYGDEIVVEFWESPLDLIGYELSRTRLKLFGFNSNDPIKITREYNSEKLRVQMGQGAGAMTLNLDKTTRFKSILIK